MDITIHTKEHGPTQVAGDEFTHVIGGREVTLTLHRDGPDYIVSDKRSGRRFTLFTGLQLIDALGNELFAAQLAVEQVVKRWGAARVCQVLDEAPAL